MLFADGAGAASLRITGGFGAVINKEQRKALNDARDQAENAFKLTELRYCGGSIGYLDVIVAQTTFIDARSPVSPSARHQGKPIPE
ncbi:MAG: hypothetical protein P8Y45_16690 [Exilibacterium sp.]